MSNEPVFISHATRDDAFVSELRLALEGLRLPVWVDSRNLRGGNALDPAIAQAIEQAHQVIVVLSPQTINSPWVVERFTRLCRSKNAARRRDTG